MSVRTWGRAGPKPALPRPDATRAPAYGTALIVNPTKVGDVGRLHRRVAKRCRVHGRSEPVVLLTTREDPGEGLARAAVRDGAGLVLSAGGDGTVMSVARGLAGTGVPLGVLPVGTGNVLARNLDLPLTLIEALEVALTGAERCIDLGIVNTDTRPAEAFTVMAGVGFDAAMVADAPSRLKAAVGWPAYVVSGVRHLRDESMAVELRLDGAPPVTRWARSVIVGNVGMLQAGLRLLPDARPDDGLLDVVVLSPRRLGDWARVVLRLALRRGTPDRDVERFQVRRVELRVPSPQPSEMDGETPGDVRCMLIEVAPRALVVRVRP